MSYFLTLYLIDTLPAINAFINTITAITAVMLMLILILFASNLSDKGLFKTLVKTLIFLSFLTLLKCLLPSFDALNEIKDFLEMTK